MGPADLREVIGRLFEEYKERAEAKNLAYHLRLCEAPTMIRIDGRGLELVLSNLFSNAVKYTEKGSIEVSLRHNEGSARIRFADTGMGIPKADLPKLFSEFFRARNARDSKIEGTGVGLAAVKEMIGRFGGELHLDTEENRGSTFTVHLPLLQN